MKIKEAILGLDGSLTTDQAIEYMKAEALQRIADSLNELERGLLVKTSFSGTKRAEIMIKKEG